MTRFSGVTAGTARWALLAALVAAALLAWTARTATPLHRVDAGAQPPSATAVLSDDDLYERLADHVARGAGYYAAAVRLNLDNGYPVRPFVTVRMPTLTWLLAHLGEGTSRLLLAALSLAFVSCWTWRLRRAMPSPMQAIVAVLALCAVATTFNRFQLVTHEVWAGLLIGISLALRTGRRWALAVALGLCALLIRETAAPYAVVMAGAALVDGRRREAAAWCATLAILAVALALHRHEVLQATMDQGTRSSGWWGVMGIGFYVRSMATNVPILGLGDAWAGALVAASFLGWIGLRGPTGPRVVALQATYVPVLAICAKGDNWYWAGLVQYVLPVGMPLAGVAIHDLVLAARGTGTSAKS